MLTAKTREGTVVFPYACITAGSGSDLFILVPCIPIMSYLTSLYCGTTQTQFALDARCSAAAGYKCLMLRVACSFSHIQIQYQFDLHDSRFHLVFYTY